jgi:hypothetical protein
MADLITELGATYCNDLMQGAMFLHEGVPYEFERALAQLDGNILVSCTRYTDDADKPKPKVVQISSTVFTDWSTLAHPQLGYRMAADGRMLAYVTKIPGVRRGISAGSLIITPHDVSWVCEENGLVDTNHFLNGTGKPAFVMCPKFFTFTEGIAKILKREIPAFAISADFAVAPNRDVKFLEVLYKQRRIGEVDEKGNAVIGVAGLQDSWLEANRGKEDAK